MNNILIWIILSEIILYFLKMPKVNTLVIIVSDWLKTYNLVTQVSHVSQSFFIEKTTKVRVIAAAPYFIETSLNEDNFSKWNSDPEALQIIRKAFEGAVSICINSESLPILLWLLIIIPMDWTSPKLIIAKYLSCSLDPTSNSETTNSNVLQFFDKSDEGQLISKCLFGIFKFFQKTKENKSTMRYHIR